MHEFWPDGTQAVLLFKIYHAWGYSCAFGVNQIYQGREEVSSQPDHRIFDPLMKVLALTTIFNHDFVLFVPVATRF